MTKLYHDIITDEIVRVLEYTGADSLSDIEKFTDYRPHDVYMLNTDDKNDVSCCISPINKDGRYARLVLVPGYRLIKHQDNTFSVACETVFNATYKELEVASDE